MTTWPLAIDEAHLVLDEAIAGLHTNDWDTLDLLGEIRIPSAPPPPAEQARIAELLARIAAFRAAVESRLNEVSAALDSTGTVEAANRAYLNS